MKTIDQQQEAQRRMFNHEVYLAVFKAYVASYQYPSIDLLDAASKAAMKIADAKYPPPPKPTNPDDLEPIL